MATIKYDAKTGKRLKKGASTTDAMGNTFKEGTKLSSYTNLKTSGVGSSSSSDPLAGGAAGRFLDMTPEQAAQASSVYERTIKAGLPMSLAGDYEASGFSSNFARANQISGSSNPAAGTAISSKSPSAPGSSLINNPNLTAKNFMDGYPEEKIQDYSSLVPLTIDQEKLKLESERELSNQEQLKSLMDLYDDRETSAESYAKAQKQSGLLQAQRLVGELTGNLNAIVAKGQAQQLSLVGQGRGVPEAIIGGQQAQIGRETAIAALPVQAQLSAAQGNLEMAQSNMETLFKIYSDDARNKFEYKKEVLTFIYDKVDKENQRKLDDLKVRETRAYEKEQDFLKTKESIAIEAAKNGASAATLTKISQATDFASVISSAGSSLVNTQVIKLDNGNTVIVDSMGRVIKNLGGAAPKTETSNNFMVNKDILKNAYGNDVVSVIASAINSSGAKQSQSTNDAINVISGLQQLVKDAPDGVFKGLAPIRLTPGKMKSEQALTNLSNIEAVNLKVQQWASGASLTEAQTKSVERMTPRKSDTDKQVIAKTNALANYMISQVSGQLAGQGIGFSMDKVDLFTKTPEQEMQTLYKDPIMKQKIIQATQMFPNYSDAEILQIVQI